MILDKQAIWSDAQAITATAISTNIINLKHITKHKGRGTPIPILVQVVTAFNTLTSLTVALESDNDVAFGSPTVVKTLTTVALASLVVGYRFDFDFLPVNLTAMNEQYWALRYTVVGSNPTLGQITAGVIGSLHQTPAAGF